MKMYARSARVIHCAALVAFLAGCGLGVLPAVAREEMSAGQAGDPTDGNGIASTSGSTYESANNSAQQVDDQRTGHRTHPELVLFINGAVYRLRICDLIGLWKRT